MSDISSLRRRLRLVAWVSLVCVYLVICAGATVRATGSGMGCPDWPMCYGYTIPPTDPAQVAWSPGRAFRPGQMIIHPWLADGEDAVRDRLLVAQGAFTTGEAFEATNWAVYERHDYAIFNPTHTWIEFINRLLGAITGLPVLLLAGIGLVLAIRERRATTALYTGAALGVLLFVAWLGKLVVDGNLMPGSITIHMFGSIALVTLLLLAIRQGDERRPVGSATWWLLAAGFVITLAQVYFGTQVREAVDTIGHHGGMPREQWVDHLPGMFYLHRAVSWLLAAVLAAWVWQMLRAGQRWWEVWAGAGLLLIQVLIGVVLVYAGFPAVVQPVHLVGALLLSGALWSALLRSRRC